LGVNAKKSHVLGLDAGGAGHRRKLRVAVSISPVPWQPVTRHRLRRGQRFASPQVVIEEAV
jgi:hypothetical protein